jgi:hypothetical protein
MYKMMLRKVILNEKVLAQNETYRNNQYNESVFQKLWKESPRTVSLRKGPKCLLRIKPLDLDSKTDEEVDRSACRCDVARLDFGTVRLKKRVCGVSA